MRYKAFISYRRGDATAVARWLRRRLLAFRPSPQLLAGLAPADRAALEGGAAAYFLDTSYEVASEDFWSQNIAPALGESERLIVISSPSALLARADGSANWVAREIDTFLETHGEAEGRRRIILVLASGAPADRFPGRLGSLGQQWDWADLRGLSRWSWLRPGVSERLDDAFLKIIAALHHVPQALLPVLRQEEARRRGRLRLAAIAATGLVVLLLSGALGWAIVERSEALREEARATRNYEGARDSVDRLIELVGNSLRDTRGISVDTVDRALAQVGTLVDELERMNPADPLLERSRATMLHEFARTYQTANDPAKAREHAARALALRRKLAAAMPDRAQLRAELAQSIDLAGDLLRAERRWDEAREQFAEGLRLRRDLLARLGDHRQAAEWRFGLSQSHVRLGDTDMDQSRLPDLRDTPRAKALVEQAAQHYRTSLAIGAVLYREAPDNERWQRELSWGFDKIGQFAAATGHPAEALTGFGHALCLRRGLMARLPQNTRYASDVSWTLQRIGNAWLAQDDREAARRAFLEAAALRRRLVTRDVRDDLVLQRDYVFILERLAEVERRGGEHQLVLALVLHAGRSRERLRDADGNIPASLSVPDLGPLEVWARAGLDEAQARRAADDADALLNARIHSEAARLLTARGDAGDCMARLATALAAVTRGEMR